jgi:hypothetical protein
MGSIQWRREGVHTQGDHFAFFSIARRLRGLGHFNKCLKFGTIYYFLNVLNNLKIFKNQFCPEKNFWSKCTPTLVDPFPYTNVFAHINESILRYLFDQIFDF